MVTIDANYHPQVLLLGNGLNQAYGGISWDELMCRISERPVSLDYVKSLNCPMPMKAILLTDDHVNTAITKHKKDFFGEAKDGLRQQLEQLLSIGFDDILTTNYSYELEAASAEKETASAYFIEKRCHNIIEGQKIEPKYLLHSYQQASFAGRENRVWHIHGEARKPSSMILGHYYYAALLHNMEAHLKSTRDTYQYRQKNNISQKIQSWIDSFILGDVYIMGFGMGFSEIDLWWLLNRKKRESAHHGTVYFYEPMSDESDEKQKLLRLLDVQILNFGVKNPTGTQEEKNRVFQEFYQLAINDIISKIQPVKATAMEGK